MKRATKKAAIKVPEAVVAVEPAAPAIADVKLEIKAKPESKAKPEVKAKEAAQPTQPVKVIKSAPLKREPLQDNKTANARSPTPVPVSGSSCADRALISYPSSPSRLSR